VGRPYWLTDITRSGLVNMGADPGHVHVTDSNADIVGPNGGADGNVDLGEDYQAHLRDIATESTVIQPFDG
jgi:hypothetical protein